MNDLLSASKNFSVDLETGGSGHQEVEMADRNSSGEEADLSGFFEEVSIIKTEMEQMKTLLGLLQKANEEGRLVTKASAMKELRGRMERMVEEVLRKAREVKRRIEALDEANKASRKLPGAGPGSSTDRTRVSITSSLAKSLKELLGQFQSLRQSIASEYKETIGRRYYTVTGSQADEDTLDHMIQTGESESFLQKAIQEQGRGQVIDTIKEIQERHNTVKDIERSLIELNQIFLDMAVLVEAQGEQLNNIEFTVQGASSFVKKGQKQLQTAKKLQRSSRKWTCIAIIILLIIIIVVAVPTLVKLLPSNSSSTPTTSPPPPPPPTNSTTTG